MMTLQEFLELPEELTTDERQQIVDQALVLIEQLYVHLPLKQAMHATDPIQRLKLLRYRLRKMSEERQFYDEMISIFTELRDMHTQYILPEGYQGKSAVLGFRVQRFFEDCEPHYMVSPPVVRRLVEDECFKAGVIVTHWNGIPIKRAVELNAARMAGSNLDASHALGLATLTVRPMCCTAPPDEEWVTVGYISEGQKCETRLYWRIIQTPMSCAIIPESASEGQALTLGINALAKAVQRTRKMLFAPKDMEIERQVANLRTGDAPEPGDTSLNLNMAEVSTRRDPLKVKTVSTPHGEFGYLRIRSFDVPDDKMDDFVAEVVRIVRLLPKNGLIVDVRGNPGGQIPAGERLLQIFTPREIEPERLHFINTALTLKLCERVETLKDWKDSIEQAVETATTFSDGFPIRPDEKQRCNSLGQQYYGPAVLVTDALCYSTADIFAAGWQDHGIGPVLGTDDNTGAGGANVAGYSQLECLLSGPQSLIQPLPKGTSFNVAVRRTTRVGERLGDLVEDLGVVPDKRHCTTRNDILKDNEDLITCAASILAREPVRALDAKVERIDDGKVLVSVTVAKVSRLDVYLDGRPRLILDVDDGTTTFELPVNFQGRYALELRGFDDANELVAAKRIEIQ
jgi:C-terminal processing protease CtpA/Prc